MILKTTNGGANWISQLSGTKYRFNSVHFTDSNNGWVVGVGGTILTTTNGGMNWNGQSILDNLYLNNVYFTDSKNGWVVGGLYAGGYWGEQICKITNGVKKWISLLPKIGYSLSSVYFIDLNNGWVVGSVGTILKTTDGGTNWKSQRSGTSNNLSSINFTDANTGTVVGGYGTILRTATGGVTWVEPNQHAGSPRGYLLSQNYPNPFNPSTMIRYELPKACNVTLKIFNTLGQEVVSLVNERKESGYYQATWTANVPSGIYFYRLQAEEFVETRKMILLH
jgi:photosystem II stability/assembly factor-like uncharacterized protein